MSINLLEINNLFLLHDDEKTGQIFGNANYFIARFGKRWITAYNAKQDEFAVYAVHFPSFRHLENVLRKEEHSLFEGIKKTFKLTEGLEKKSDKINSYVQIINRMNGKYCIVIASNSTIPTLQIIRIAKGANAEFCDFIKTFTRVLKDEAPHGPLFMNLTSITRNDPVKVYLKQKTDPKLNYLIDVDVIFNISERLSQQATVIEYIKETNCVLYYYTENRKSNLDFYLDLVPDIKQSSLSLPPPMSCQNRLNGNQKS